MRSSWWHPVQRIRQNHEAKHYQMYRDRGERKRSIQIANAERKSSERYSFPTPRGSGLKRLLPPHPAGHPVRGGYSPHDLFQE